MTKQPAKPPFPTWTEPYYGITHLGQLRAGKAWCSVCDYGKFCLLYRRFMGVTIETRHKTVDAAKRVAAKWLRQRPFEV